MIGTPVDLRMLGQCRPVVVELGVPKERTLRRLHVSEGYLLVGDRVPINFAIATIFVVVRDVDAEYPVLSHMRRETKEQGERRAEHAQIRFRRSSDKAGEKFATRRAVALLRGRTRSIDGR